MKPKIKTIVYKTVYKCKKCGRFYQPVVTDFPAPDQCDCGAKDFITIERTRT